MNEIENLFNLFTTIAESDVVKNGDEDKNIEVVNFFDLNNFTSEFNESVAFNSFDSFNSSVVNSSDVFVSVEFDSVNYWWGLLASMLVAFTAAGNVLVCCAIYLERRLQNVTNYFLMSLAITDLLVAMLVMPVGILTLMKGKFYKYS